MDALALLLSYVTLDLIAAGLEGMAEKSYCSCDLFSVMCNCSALNI